MRRILITDEIKRFAKDYSLKMEDEKNFRKGESPKARLLALCNQLKRFGTVVKILKKKGRLDIGWSLAISATSRKGYFLLLQIHQLRITMGFAGK